jgi:hypothetical protein
MRSSLVFSLLIIALIISCTSVPKEVQSNQLPPFKPNFYAIDRKDSIQIIFNYNDVGTNKDKLEFINAINNITVNFKSSNKKTIKSLILTKMIMKQTTVNYKMTTTLLAQGFYVPNTRANIDPVTVELNIFMDSTVYTMQRPYADFVRKFSFDNKNAMNLLPIVEKLDSVNYFIGLIALRKSMPGKEYLSSSEDFRVELFGPKGNLIWCTNYKQNYMQAKQPVKPLNIGDYYLYSTVWNGRNNNDVRILEGDFALKLSIPAQPNPYFVTLNMKTE